MSLGFSLPETTAQQKTVVALAGIFIACATYLALKEDYLTHKDDFDSQVYTHVEGDTMVQTEFYKDKMIRTLDVNFDRQEYTEILEDGSSARWSFKDADAKGIMLTRTLYERACYNARANGQMIESRRYCAELNNP